MIRITVTRGPEKWYSKRPTVTVHEFTHHNGAMAFLKDLRATHVNDGYFSGLAKVIQLVNLSNGNWSRFKRENPHQKKALDMDVEQAKYTKQYPGGRPGTLKIEVRTI